MESLLESKTTSIVDELKENDMKTTNNDIFKVDAANSTKECPITTVSVLVASKFKSMENNIEIEKEKNCRIVDDPEENDRKTTNNGEILEVNAANCTEKSPISIVSVLVASKFEENENNIAIELGTTEKEKNDLFDLEEGEIFDDSDATADLAFVKKFSTSDMNNSVSSNEDFNGLLFHPTVSKRNLHDLDERFEPIPKKICEDLEPRQLDQNHQVASSSSSLPKEPYGISTNQMSRRTKYSAIVWEKGSSKHPPKNRQKYPSVDWKKDGPKCSFSEWKQDKSKFSFSEWKQDKSKFSHQEWDQDSFDPMEMKLAKSFRHKSVSTNKKSQSCSQQRVKSRLLDKQHSSVFSRLGDKLAHTPSHVIMQAAESEAQDSDFDEDEFYLENFPLYKKWRGKLTAPLLATCLSYFKNFTASLQNFSQRCCEEIFNVIYNNDCTFVCKATLITLKPKLQMCSSHIGSVGCGNKMQCTSLHVCLSYVKGLCKLTDCSYGHSWLTDHNKNVLGRHYINTLKPSILENLIFSAIDLCDSLEICKYYNEKGCNKINCLNLHLCFNFVAGNCSKENCSLNHSVTDSNTVNILNSCNISINESPRDILMSIRNCSLIKRAVESWKRNASKQNTLSKNTVSSKNDYENESAPNSQSTTQSASKWAHHITGDVLKVEICHKSVTSFCPLEESGCPKLHCIDHFHWQIREKKKPWINLPNAQVFSLEKEFSDPNVNVFDLPPLDPSTSSPLLLVTMKGKSIWKSDFSKMQLILKSGGDINSSNLELRRLDSGSSLRSFLWYFLNSNNEWIEYGKHDLSNEKISNSSVNSKDINAHLEKKLNEPLHFRTGHFSYAIDLINFCQTNLSTNVKREIKRRPKPFVLNKSTSDFPDDWDSMKPDERYVKVLLKTGSNEYNSVLSIVQRNSGTFIINRIARVQNPFLFNAFQNKIHDMKKIYKLDSDLNIRQLFHGTKFENIDSICAQNFDWRLHGSSTGQAYGRGTYFSPSAKFAHGYCSGGNKTLFIARVIVGKTIAGNSSIVRPPTIPATSTLYDSTVDNIQDPSVIVKYDSQEYYPEYILSVS